MEHFASPSEAVRQVRNFFATHDVNIETIKVACECAQGCMTELLQVLEELFAGDDRRALVSVL